MSYRIVVSDTKVIDLDAGRPAFDGLEVSVETTDANSPEAVIEAAAGADALVVDASTQVTGRVLAALDSLAVVGRAGIGVDNIDLGAAEARGVTVLNVPGYSVDEVATHALALFLACLRRLGAYDRSVRNGDWDWTVGQPLPRLAGSTVGLVAFGKIARNLAGKLDGFDVDVLAYDPYVDAAAFEGYDVRRAGFEELLAASDAVSIHTPLTGETRRMFDADAFDRMREGSILVNTARGPVVDEDALYAALTDGPLAAAGLDVRDTEPPESSRLAELETVISAPHAGWYSEASRRELNRTVAADVARALRGDPPENPVTTDAAWQ